MGFSGVNASGTTARPIGNILDDSLSVLDYGAVGDGLTDDTAAIQQAIADEWARISEAPASPLSSRNTIHFPAGKYLVSESILLYPYITLQGEGVYNTSVSLAPGASGPVFRTADSLGQTDANIGTNGAILPIGISVLSMTIDGSADHLHDVVLLQRCQRVLIQFCRLVGAWNSLADPLTYKGAVLVQSLGTAVVTRDIVIRDCLVTSVSYGIQCSDPVSRLLIQLSQISNSYIGVNLQGGDAGPLYTQISQCVFDSVSAYGIYVNTTKRMTSLGNTFNVVGEAAAVPVIYWTAGVTASSIGDTFSTGNLQRIYNGNPATCLILDQQQAGFTVARPSMLTATLQHNTVNGQTGIVWSVAGLTSVSIQLQYSITFGTYRRTGQLQIISDGHTAAVSDTNTQLNSVLVLNFDVAVSGTNLQLLYTSSSGNATSGTMSYIYSIWQS